jgi:hypothetical protein
MNAKTFRALLFSLTNAERLTFGKIIVEKLIEQPDGIYDLIRLCVLNLSIDEQREVNLQIKRVKALFSEDISPAISHSQHPAIEQRAVESSDVDS